MVNIVLIYDGSCPLCKTYVRYARLKETAGTLSLIDARNNKAQVMALKKRDMDINQGMVLIIGNNSYFGSDCIHMLALLSSKSGWFNKINAALFSHSHIAKWVYPLMRFGRRVALKLLGVPLIDTYDSR